MAACRWQAPTESQKVGWRGVAQEDGRRVAALQSSQESGLSSTWRLRTQFSLMGQRMGSWSACQTWLSAQRGGGGAVPVISAGPGGRVVLGLTRKSWDFVTDSAD